MNVAVDVVRVDERRESELRRRASEVRVVSVGPVSAPDDVVRVERVAKCFGEVVALCVVNLHLRQGAGTSRRQRQHGKSTLIGLIAGFRDSMWGG